MFVVHVLTTDSYTLNSFDTVKCQQLCDSVQTCTAFNAYIERGKSKHPCCLGIDTTKILTCLSRSIPRARRRLPEPTKHCQLQVLPLRLTNQQHDCHQHWPMARRLPSRHHRLQRLREECSTTIILWLHWSTVSRRRNRRSSQRGQRLLPRCQDLPRPIRSRPVCCCMPGNRQVRILQLVRLEQEQLSSWHVLQLL